MMIKVHGDGLVLTPLSHFTESGLESIANKGLSVYTFKSYYLVIKNIRKHVYKYVL